MKRTGFTSGERMIATEHDCHVFSMVYRTPGNFWCHTCGHKFAVGDGYRWIYSNGHSPSAGNFMVCDTCDIGNEKMIEIRQEAIKLLSIVPDEYDAAMIIAYQLCLKNNAIARHKQSVLANYDEPDCSIIENLELWNQIDWSSRI